MSKKTLLPIIKIDEELINKCKHIELDILLKFDAICKEHELKYFLFAGTLLGAIRHKGFIPWDDDIDVCMPRNDYMKFMEIGQRLLPNDLFLQNHNTDKEYTLPFAKIRKLNTSFVEFNSQKKNINHGIFIDIFPIDGYPSKPKEIKKYVFRQRMLKNVCYRSYLGNSFKSKIKSIPIVLLTGFKSARKVINKYEKFVLNNKFGTTDRVMIFDCISTNKTYSYDSFNESILVDFEKCKLCSPVNYDKYLTEEFGDYMTPPLIENRVSGHKLVLVDLEKGFNK